jgi:hypothetical protein
VTPDKTSLGISAGTELRSVIESFFRAAVFAVVSR